MNTLVRCAIAALLSGLVPVWVHAADTAARVRPNPPGTVSDSSSAATAAAVAETYRTGADGGVVRLRAGNGAAVERAVGSDLPTSVTVRGPDGRSIRIVAGALPDPAVAPRSAALPPGAVVVQVGQAAVLRMPGVADGLHAPVPDARLPPGMRIVDLPPGAVGPQGMPEPMTLYRATPASPSAATTPR